MKRRAVLGIEFDSHEVRVVEMRAGTVPELLRVGVATIPESSPGADPLAQPEQVAGVLRDLLTRMGCRTRDAVLGVDARHIMTRTLSVPRVPDAEMRVVMEGELAHYQILRAGTGAFDFFPLAANTQSQQALPSYLLMAAEGRVERSYRDILDRAGLHPLALEPVPLALLRAGFPLLRREPATLCIAITPQRTELSILDQGSIRLYRRMDMGADDFFRGRGGSTVNLSGPMDLTDEEVALRLPLPEMSEDSTRAGFAIPPWEEGQRHHGKKLEEIAPTAAGVLSSEMQRTLDYYRREFPQATAIERIVLVSDEPALDLLADWLARTLGREVIASGLPLDIEITAEARDQLEAQSETRYLSAVGLALHTLMPEWTQIPRFDLRGEEIAEPLPADRDRIIIRFIVAAGILIGGLFAGNLFHRLADLEGGNVRVQQTVLQAQEQDAEASLRRMEAEQQLAALIESDNLPMPAILNQLTRSLPERIRLVSLIVEPDGLITMEGDALIPEDFRRYYDSLMNNRHLVAPEFGTLTTDSRTGLTHFKVETSLLGTQHGRLSQLAGMGNR